MIFQVRLDFSRLNLKLELCRVTDQSSRLVFQAQNSKNGWTTLGVNLNVSFFSNKETKQVDFQPKCCTNILVTQMQLFKLHFCYILIINLFFAKRQNIKEISNCFQIASYGSNKRNPVLPGLFTFLHNWNQIVRQGLSAEYM